MMKPIDLTIKEHLIDALEENNIKMSELNFSNILMWRNKYNFHYIEIDSFLFILNITDSSTYSSQPIGNLQTLETSTLNKLKIAINEDKVFFKKCNQAFLDRLEWLDTDYSHNEVRDDFDYLYDFEGLKNLRGKLYHKKKNHVNHFMKKYNWHYELLNSNNQSAIHKICEVWFENANDDLLFEKEAIQEGLKYMDELNLQGGILYVDKHPVAFTIGEIIHQNTLLIHYEKALHEYPGAYTTIMYEFLQSFQDIEFINREQDLGIPGLRKSKLSYHPVDFVKKFNVIIE